MFHTVHYVTLPIVRLGNIKVNPLMVGAVYTDPDRKDRVCIVLGGVLHRVVGNEADVLAALGWTASESPKAAEPGKPAGEPPKAASLGKK